VSSIGYNHHENLPHSQRRLESLPSEEATTPSNRGSVGAFAVQIRDRLVRGRQRGTNGGSRDCSSLWQCREAKLDLQEEPVVATSPVTKTKQASAMTSASGFTAAWTRLVAFGPLVLQTTPYQANVSVKTFQLDVTSTSTKPWPLGHPTEWTPHQRVWYNRIGGEGSATIQALNAEGTKYVRQFVQGSMEAACSLPQGTEWGLHKVPLDPGTAAVSAKLRGKLKDDFNAAVALAELNKTVDLIASTARKIGQALLAVKSGNTKRALELLGNPKLKKLSYKDESAIRRRHRTKRERETASKWLELQYGWMPLYNDVYNAVEYATKKSPPGNPIVRCGVSSVVSSDNVFPWSGNPFEISMTQRYILSGKVGRRMVVEYQIDSAYLNRVSNVGLTNPLVVAWELVPFSFVVDWFLPLGDWLNGLDATMGLTFVKGSSTFYYQVQQKVEFAALKNSLGSTAFFQGTQEFAFKKRESMVSFPEIQRPVVKNPISVGHAANALALLVSAFHK